MAPRMPARCWAALQRSAKPSLLACAAAAAAATIPKPFLPLTTTRGVKYGWSTLHPRSRFQIAYNQGNGLPDPSTGPRAAQKRKDMSTPLRTGVLATKKGMTAYYTRNGKRMACTVLQMDQVQVVAHKTAARDGYCAVQVGCGSRRADNVAAPQLGYFEAKGIAPKEHLAEFQIKDESGLVPVGVQLMPDWFHKGQRVDVQGTTRGQGFAGGMKRHGFSGQNASHGNSKNHRTMGTVGPSQGSGSRILPGKKMPGRMGNQKHTVQNLPVLRVDNDLGIIVVKGAVAGSKGTLVKISDAVKKDPPKQAFIEKTQQLLNERFPQALEDLTAARLRHMELKTLRREGRIEDAMKEGLTEGRNRPSLAL